MHLRCSIGMSSITSLVSLGVRSTCHTSFQGPPRGGKSRISAPFFCTRREKSKSKTHREIYTVSSTEHYHTHLRHHTGFRRSGRQRYIPTSLSLSGRGQRGSLLSRLTGRQGFIPYSICHLNLVKLSISNTAYNL